jgi:hypothetical protein
MRIEIDIERLVLDGLDLTRREQLDLRHSIETELIRLLSIRAPAADVRHGSTRCLPDERRPAGTGHGASIAGAVHRAITSAAAPSGIAGERR